MNEESGKKLGMMNIIGLGLGGAIGTGIFVLLGDGIAYTGRSIVLVVALGCFLMLLAYWYNLAMSTIFVFKGGDYGMKTMLFSPLLTGFSAWRTVMGAFGMSSYAIAIANYLAIAIPDLKQYQTITAFLVMTLVFLTTIKGSKFVTILENIVTIVLVAALLLFIVFGVGKVDFGMYFSSAYDGGFFHGGVKGFFSAIAIMGWACQGTTMGPVAMAAVTKNPKRTIPVGIIIITVLLAVIYGFMAFVAGGVLPFDTIAGVNISVTAESIFPHSIYMFFVVGGGIGAIASSLLGGLAMFRYPLMRVAEDGWLPAVFKKTTKSGYPWATYLGCYVIAILPILTGMPLSSVVSLVMIPTMLMNIYMNLACMCLPRKYPEQWEKRSIRIPLGLYNLFCILGAASAGMVVYNLFVDLSFTAAIWAIVIVALLIGLSEIRLKQGAVKREELKMMREETIREAIEAEFE